MSLKDLISLERTHVGAPGLSKKRTLELAARLAAESAPAIPGQSPPKSADLFDALLARERLGSTALGQGIALPHGRIAAGATAMGVLIRLADPLPFDAPDGQPVDLVFALFVPEDQCQPHLDTLAELARLFSEPELLQRLRAANDNFSLHERMLDWLNSTHPQP
ncbi:MAG: PTS sugar transporter subunit IIA [Gammaproteobacteria bacterium]|nr:PTS sugar transporter subunit IIA [Gammaproteobacteria bacterium]